MMRRGAEADPRRDLVRLGDEPGLEHEGCCADPDMVAGLERKAIEEGGVGDGAVAAIMRREEGCERPTVRVRHGAADGRIMRVDGLHLDERDALVAGIRHRPQGRDGRYAPLALEDRGLGRACFALH